MEIVGKQPEQQSIWMQLLVASAPILIIIVVFMFFMRQMQGGAGGKGGPMSFGKSKARLMSEDQIKTTFADVAGCDDQLCLFSRHLFCLSRSRWVTHQGPACSKHLSTVALPLYWRLIVWS